MPGRGRRTVTRSFRVDGNALEVLEEDAASMGISANTLLNQILVSYADFERYFSILPMVKMASDSFSYLLDSLSEDEVAETGRRTAENIVKSVIMAKHGKITLASILDYFRMMSDHSKLYKYTQHGGNQGRSITLIHGWGRKGSVYYSEYVKAVFSMIGISPRMTLTDNSVSAEY